MRDGVESWREAVLVADSVLGWQQVSLGLWVPWCEHHPGVASRSHRRHHHRRLPPHLVSTTPSSSSSMPRYMDPTLVTLAAVVGLLLTLADYLGPRLLDRLYRPDAWTDAKERRLEAVCRSLASLRLLLSSLCSSLGALRANSPILHFGAVSSALVVVAWLGTVFSGLFLLYTASMLLVMLPGLHRSG